MFYMQNRLASLFLNPGTLTMFYVQNRLASLFSPVSVTA